MNNNKKVEINVPCRIENIEEKKIPMLTTINKFCLAPSQTNSWKTSFTNGNGDKEELTSLDILFQSATNKKTKYLETLQRAVLIVDLKNSNENGNWQFFGDGIVVTDPLIEKHFTVTTELTNNNQTLYVIIDKMASNDPEMTKSLIAYATFLYSASLTSRDDNGEIITYHLSKDPSIGVGRPVDQ